MKSVDFDIRTAVSRIDNFRMSVGTKSQERILMAIIRTVKPRSITREIYYTTLETIRATA